MEKILLLIFIFNVCNGVTYFRFNQVSYNTNEKKVIVALRDEKILGGSYFVVEDAETGNNYFESEVHLKSFESWNGKYNYAYQLDFSPLKREGQYRLVLIEGNTNTTSPIFSVSSDSSIYEQLLSNSLFFFRAQRDGPNIDPTVMHRKPSHLADEEAFLYAPPVYENDELQDNLTQVGGPIDVSGGWFDAGDYLKFVQTASYVVDLMLLALRDYNIPSNLQANLTKEAQYGINWLLKMWNEEKNSLYYQVGIGDGNGDTILGDHDLWRLPEADDEMNVQVGDSEYYIKYRPVFFTGPEISPNLAGRLAAAFSLCHQIFQSSDPKLAKQCLQNSIQIYKSAQVNPPPSQLITAAPFDFYPETEWRDDMELGAVMLYLSTGEINYLEDAANWALNYINNATNKDYINLYDISGLAHYELLKVMRSNSSISLPIDENFILNDMGELLSQGISQSSGDPFHFALQYDSGDDLVPTSIGYFLESQIFYEISGNDTFVNVSTRQIDWLLGCNAWGVSFIIGAGFLFPQCPQHQVANLAGSLNGTTYGDLTVLFGATVDGPSDVDNFNGLGVISNANTCPNPPGDPYKEFTGKGVRFYDNVVAWPSVEPADDYTVISLYAFARILSN